MVTHIVDNALFRLTRGHRQALKQASRSIGSVTDALDELDRLEAVAQSQRWHMTDAPADDGRAVNLPEGTEVNESSDTLAFPPH